MKVQRCVTKRLDLLVVADPNTMSSKAMSGAGVAGVSVNAKPEADLTLPGRGSCLNLRSGVKP